MTPEAQRIAIAEACEWQDIEPNRAGFGGFLGWRDKWPYDDRPHLGRDIAGIGGRFRGHVPDYLNDLNAMREVEKTLTEAERADYRERLMDGTLEDICDLDIDAAYWVLIHATAAQRAEAFLRAKGLWKE